MGKQSSPPPQYNSAPWQGQPPQGQGTHMSAIGPIHDGSTASNPIDFYGAAQQQGNEARQALGQQTQANRPDQTNAFGASVNWTRGSDGSWHQTQSFGGPLGGLEQSLAGQAANSMGSPLDFSKLPGLESGDQARDQAIQSAYGQATSRLDPQWSQREQAQRTQLINEGLDQSSPAYTKAMDDFGRQRNDAYTSAMNSAIGQGSQAGALQFGESLQSRNQFLAEMLRQRGQPLADLQGLNQLTGQDKFNTQNSLAMTPWLQAAMATGNYGLQQVNQSNQNASGIVGGGMDLASALAALG